MGISSFSGKNFSSDNNEKQRKNGNKPSAPVARKGRQGALSVPEDRKDKPAKNLPKDLSTQELDDPDEENAEENTPEDYLTEDLDSPIFAHDNVFMGENYSHNFAEEETEDHASSGSDISSQAYDFTTHGYHPHQEGLSPWERMEAGELTWEEFPQMDKERIVRHYAPKIRFLALRLKVKLPKNIELSELISAGTLGLLEALGKFQASLHIRFETYAENRIRGAMLDELRRLDWFPRSLRQRVRQLDQAVWQIEHEKGRPPTLEELKEHTGLPEKEISQGLEALQNQLCISLDAIQDSLAGDGTPEGEPYKNTALTEMVDRVAALIDTLTPREKLVLSLYYSDELNMRETADIMGITEGRVSQLHTQALTRLRREFHEKYGENGDME